MSNQQHVSTQERFDAAKVAFSGLTEEEIALKLDFASLKELKTQISVEENEIRERVYTSDEAVAFIYNRLVEIDNIRGDVPKTNGKIVFTKSSLRNAIKSNYLKPMKSLYGREIHFREIDLKCYVEFRSRSNEDNYRILESYFAERIEQIEEAREMMKNMNVQKLTETKTDNEQAVEQPVETEDAENEKDINSENIQDN